MRGGVISRTVSLSRGTKVFAFIVASVGSDHVKKTPTKLTPHWSLLDWTKMIKANFGIPGSWMVQNFKRPKMAKNGAIYMDAHSQKRYQKFRFILHSATHKKHFSTLSIDLLWPYMCTTTIFANFDLTRQPLAKSVLTPQNRWKEENLVKELDSMHLFSQPFQTRAVESDFKKSNKSRMPKSF